MASTFVYSLLLFITVVNCYNYPLIDHSINPYDVRRQKDAKANESQRTRFHTARYTKRNPNVDSTATRSEYLKPSYESIQGNPPTSNQIQGRNPNLTDQVSFSSNLRQNLDPVPITDPVSNSTRNPPPRATSHNRQQKLNTDDSGSGNTTFTCELYSHFCHYFCNDTGGEIGCSCKEGFYLERDNRTCKDINECFDPNIKKCDQRCHNAPGNYSCSCYTGYVLRNGFTCDDINECSDSLPHACDQECHNVPGSYFCSCRPGYVQVNRYRCQACRVNSYRSENDSSCVECPLNSHTEAKERSSLKACICNHGFVGDPAKGHPCTDVNECSERNFGCSHICINTPGGALCTCPPGFKTGEDGKTCRDIDECSIKNGGCVGICKNTAGSFSCSCGDGFRLGSDKYSCIDIDECSDANGGCSHNCTNFNGGYFCSCADGYTLNWDSQSCTAITCRGVTIPNHSVVKCFPKLQPSKSFKMGAMPKNTKFVADTVCRLVCLKGYETDPNLRDVLCLKSGKWNASLPLCTSLRCPALEVPVNGDIHPSQCKDTSVAVRQKCTFTCSVGYRLQGNAIATCRRNRTWALKTPPKCLPVVPVYLICPDDIIVDLKKNLSYANVTIPVPATNSQYRVEPNWVVPGVPMLFPAGQTKVYFLSGYISGVVCTMSVNIIDKEAPSFLYCPESFEVSEATSTSGVSVYWEDPLVVDNVGIASVTPNLEPNSTLFPGLYTVVYQARDFAGNQAHCTFEIEVTGVQCPDLPNPVNGNASCIDWSPGKICDIACYPGFTREVDIYACDESGTWYPEKDPAPCLPEVV